MLSNSIISCSQTWIGVHVLPVDDGKLNHFANENQVFWLELQKQAGTFSSKLYPLSTFYLLGRFDYQFRGFLISNLWDHMQNFAFECFFPLKFGPPPRTSILHYELQRSNRKRRSVGRTIFRVTSMLVTDVGDQMCWWQVTSPTSRVRHQHQISVTNITLWHIMILETGLSYSDFVNR